MDRGINWTELVNSDKLTIATMWDLFSKIALTKKSSDVQIKEIRKVYYAGFIECFRIMVDVVEDLPEDEACLLLQKLNEEGDAFIKEAIKGSPPHS